MIEKSNGPIVQIKCTTAFIAINQKMFKHYSNIVALFYLQKFTKTNLATVH